MNKLNQLRFAVTSCANFADGYFTTYRKIAERNDLHAVIELGDYIYDVPEGTVRTAVPNDELLTLSDYRTRHAQHKLDPDLRAAHQRYPWLMIWDDHEVANNAWQDGAAATTSVKAITKPANKPPCGLISNGIQFDCHNPITNLNGFTAWLATVA